MIYLYFVVLFLFSFYSYSLLDPNITLINSHFWEVFRNNMVYFGYYQRSISSVVYIFFIFALFLFNYYFFRKYKKINIIQISIITGLILVFSYPFLSHDFFNYMFDAKILTVYGKNPYFFRALDFPQDSWLLFMRWTHRTYPYGPVFLPLTLIPSFLSLGKLILNFLFFKIFFFSFYFLSVFFLNKINKKQAVFFATSPFILIEGLVNTHNDLISLSLALIGMYFLLKNNFLSRIFLLLSAGIKYMTFPLIFITKKTNLFMNKLIIALLFLILIYMSFFMEVQSWYFLILFVLLPLYEKIVYSSSIFFAGLLFSYYPYIALGDWGAKGNVLIKHWIIAVFFIANIIYLVLYNFIITNKYEKNI